MRDRPSPRSATLDRHRLMLRVDGGYPRASQTAAPRRVQRARQRGTRRGLADQRRRRVRGRRRRSQRSAAQLGTQLGLARRGRQRSRPDTGGEGKPCQCKMGAEPDHVSRACQRHGCCALQHRRAGFRQSAGVRQKRWRSRSSTCWRKAWPMSRFLPVILICMTVAKSLFRRHLKNGRLRSKRQLASRITRLPPCRSVSASAAAETGGWLLCHEAARNLVAACGQVNGFSGP